MCELMVQSDAGYATQVKTKPSLIWSLSKKHWSSWSTVPMIILPAHAEQQPALHEYGKSIPLASTASRIYVSPSHSIFSWPWGVSRITTKLTTSVRFFTFCDESWREFFKYLTPLKAWLSILAVLISWSLLKLSHTGKATDQTYAPDKLPK